MNLRKHIRALLAVVALPAAMQAVTSCSAGTDEPAGGVSGDIWLAFDIRNTVPAGSRAPHTEEAATADENYINCADYDLTLMLLDIDRRLFRIIDRNDYVVAPAGDDGLYKTYSLMARVSKDIFAYAGADIPVSLMVVANHRGISDDYEAPGAAHLFATATEISDARLSFAFPAQATPWTPSISAGRHIPMAGLGHFAMSRAALDAATDRTTAVDLGTLDVQRAVAKIRVLDDIEDETNMRITSVRILGAATRGAFMPSISLCPEWGAGTCQVESSSAHTAWFDASVAVPTLQGTHRADDGKKYTSFTAYLPEYTYASGTEPVLEVTTECTADGGATVRTYTRRLSEAGISDIVRNHIYELYVNVRANTGLELQYTVCEWVTMPDVNIDFN